MVLDTTLKDQILELIDRNGFSVFYEHLLLAVADWTTPKSREVTEKSPQIPRDSD
jgi:hypothetical protein